MHANRRVHRRERTQPQRTRARDGTLSLVTDDQPRDLLATALAAYNRLAELGETVEDEWTYVTKLAQVGRARLRAAVPDRSRGAPLDRAGAIEALAAEAGRITDPHRAIDWLSTFPAVAELAFGGPPDPAPARPPSGGA